MWAIGVVVYVLLGGYPPFHDDGTKEGHRKVMVKIKNADFEFDPEFWDPVSADAKALIRGLLTLNPTQRLTVDQALAHPWVSISAAAIVDVVFSHGAYVVGCWCCAGGVS